MTLEQIREEALRRYPVKINFQDEGDNYDQNEDFRKFWIEGAKFVLDDLKDTKMLPIDNTQIQNVIDTFWKKLKF